MVRSNPPCIYFAGWGADYPDPDKFLRVAVFKHDFGWEDATYRGLVEEAGRIMDHSERIRMYRQADRILIEQAALMPTYYVQANTLPKPWIKGFNISPMMDVRCQDIIIEPHQGQGPLNFYGRHKNNKSNEKMKMLKDCTGTE